MTLSADTITEISRSVAAEHSPDIEVLGVVSSEGGSDRVELLITITGCHTEPCRFLINLTCGRRRAGSGAAKQVSRGATQPRRAVELHFPLLKRGNR
jgi:hypothetical protein